MQKIIQGPTMETG